MADAVLTRKQHRRTGRAQGHAESPAVAVAAAGHEGEDQMDTAH